MKVVVYGATAFPIIEFVTIEHYPIGYILLWDNLGGRVPTWAPTTLQLITENTVTPYTFIKSYTDYRELIGDVFHGSRRPICEPTEFECFEHVIRLCYKPNNKVKFNHFRQVII